VNRYDGIDLPKNACRLLVIDGLPNFRKLIDQIETNIVTENSRKIAQLIQKVEQGMGRGVRSSDDYCAVFLIGRNLTRQLYSQNAIDLFSPSTKAQIDLSDKISEQIKGTSSEIKESIMYCLTRNQQWVSLSKSVLASLSYDKEKEKEIDPITIAQRRAFDLGLRKNYKDAAKCLDDCIKLIENNLNLTSYLKQCLAEYINFYDTVEAQQVLKSAVRHNSRIIKPLEGIEYHKLQSKSLEQAKICSNYLRENFDDPNKIIIEINGFLESLIFKPNTANLFEESLAKIARFIGFNSQRPENEYSQGPDVIWEIGNLKYFVIECKNGITNKEKINKRDCNQLNGSFTWFRNKYDSSCHCTPIMIHPSLHPEYAASLSYETRIINEEKLEFLKKNIHSFIKSLCANNHKSY
jgi:hypothetical protein